MKWHKIVAEIINMIVFVSIVVSFLYLFTSGTLYLIKNAGLTSVWFVMVLFLMSIIASVSLACKLSIKLVKTK